MARESAWPIFSKVGLCCGALVSLSFLLLGSRSGVDKMPNMEVFFSPVTVFLMFVALVAAALFSRNKENAFLGIAVTWVGVYYVAWSLSHLFLVREIRPDGLLYTLFLFVVIWTLDIGAYLGGMKFGRLKLAEYVSPKKTWEGVLAGSFSAVAAAGICQQVASKVFGKPFALNQAIFLGLVIVVLAQLSDLSESLFKRNLQVKDSGNLLPGHGGILDRFDSFLLTAPVYYYLLVFFVAR